MLSVKSARPPVGSTSRCMTVLSASTWTPRPCPIMYNVTFPSGRTADALKVTHPSAIVWAAQMGTITLHPWQVRCPDAEHPDELRVDLDPQPGTGFREASAIAVDVLKPILDELGLVGYAKTSGGRGVHVFLRIELGNDWLSDPAPDDAGN